jgi:hypothetical protein
LGLAEPEDFRGVDLLARSIEPSLDRCVLNADNPLWSGLRALGFTVRLERGRFQPGWLREADELWIFSGTQPGLTAEDEAAVVAFVEEGKGLYLLADNAPYSVDADRLARRLFNTTVAGDYAGRP